MKAVSLLAPGSIDITEIPEPEVGSEDVMIEVRYVGLCGSDLNTYRGRFPLVTYPRIPGHEISGIVVDKGSAVPESLERGDKVMLDPYSSCGVCTACRAGRPNACQSNQTLGLQRDGALTDRFSIHHSKVYASKSLSLEALAIVEPLSVGYHATNRGRIGEMDTVLIMGCGTIGLGAIAAAARKGATVIVSDIDNGKLEEARKLGAQHTINATSQDVLSTVKELTRNEGVSVAIEAAGLPETFRLALESVSFAGRVVCIGYSNNDVCYDTTKLVRRELDVVGARNALRVFPAVIRMMELGRQPFKDIITRIYPFQQAAQAFRDWDADPTRFTKILIDVQDKQH
jgi:2-desacetyl-2-hydroxyethyl bacteriochlorophyllide A dehydrogenase